MSEPNDGGTIFIHSGDQSLCRLTLRDYFAGQALQRLAVRLLTKGEKSNALTREGQLKWVTSDCYAIADAMLAEREKPQ